MSIIIDAAASNKSTADTALFTSRAAPTKSEPPPIGSRLALRDDGALLVSLEDAPNRDTTGREVVVFMVLTQEEASGVRASMNEALSAAAAHTLGRLSRKGSAQS